MKSHIPDYKALMRYAKILGFGQIHTKIDKETGLHAIVAVHSTKLGPAIGGCRCFSYPAPELALKDALRLSYSMTLKAAACGLPNGGAKAVILKPAHITDREALFHSFGDFVNSLNGDYITAVDIGTGADDMTHIAQRTPFVIGAKNPDFETNPSIHTALGVLRSIQAAVFFTMKKDSLKGIRIAVQGVGKAGYKLVGFLVERGAIVTIADVHADLVKRCQAEFDVTVVSPEKIESIECDVFAPCAMGGTVNRHLIDRIKARIIAGAANNQLAHQVYAQTLKNKGILYLPDFFINAGGLINAAISYTSRDLNLAEENVNKIYDNTLALLARAQKENITTTQAAEEIAKERLQ